MNLGQIRLRVTQSLPQGTGQTLPAQQINDIINHGCDEINLLTGCYVKTFPFNIPLSSGPTPVEFSLSAICPGYLGIEKVGVWFFDVNGASHYLYPKTKRWMDIYIRNWRDSQGSSIPTWYYINNDELGLYPYVNISGTSITVDAIAKATPMTSDSNFPWTNSVTEFTTLRCMDNAIVAYTVWKLAPALMDKEGRNYFEQQFAAEIKKSIVQLNNRKDMTSSDDYYMNPGIGGGFLPR